MIGILIITHGTLGESLIQCATHVLNRKITQLKQLSIHPQDDPIQVLPRARSLVAELDTGQGVLILSDMYGGTPSNIAAKLVAAGKVEAVAGVSLPMLIRALTYRDHDLQTIVVKAVSGGCEGVTRIPTPRIHNAAARS